MIENPLSTSFFSSAMDHWYGHPINTRWSLCRLCKMNIMVQLMQVLRPSRFDNSWKSSGFLSKPWLLFIVTIEAQFKLMIILSHIVKWSMSSFVVITCNIWFNKTLSLLFIVGKIINLLIHLQSLFQKQTLLSFVLCFGFRKLQLCGGCTNVILAPKSPECCVDGRVYKYNFTS